MSQIKGKFIENRAITSSKLDSSSDFTTAGLTVNSGLSQIVLGGSNDLISVIGDTSASISIESNVQSYKIQADTSSNFNIINVDSSKTVLTIDGTGNIGINNLQPKDNIHIFDTTAAGLTLQDSTGEFQVGTSEGIFYINDIKNSTQSLSFDQNSQSFILGGTTTINGDLVVNGVIDTTEAILINANSSNPAFLINQMGSGIGLSVNSNGIGLVVEKGPVGIDTTDPQTVLHIQQDSLSVFETIESTHVDTISTAGLTLTTPFIGANFKAKASGAEIGTTTDNDLLIIRNNTPQISITGSGVILQEGLLINGDSYTDGTSVITGALGVGITNPTGQAHIRGDDISVFTTIETTYFDNVASAGLLLTTPFSGSVLSVSGNNGLVVGSTTDTDVNIIRNNSTVINLENNSINLEMDTTVANGNLDINDGSLMVGFGSPSTLIHVRGTSAIPVVETIETTNPDSNAGISLISPNANAQINVSDSSALIIGTITDTPINIIKNNDSVITIDALSNINLMKDLYATNIYADNTVGISGALGIGTDTPSYPLHISSFYAANDVGTLITNNSNSPLSSATLYVQMFNSTGIIRMAESLVSGPFMTIGSITDTTVQMVQNGIPSLNIDSNSITLLKDSTVNGNLVVSGNTILGGTLNSNGHPIIGPLSSTDSSVFTKNLSASLDSTSNFLSLITVPQDSSMFGWGNAAVRLKDSGGNNINTYFSRFTVKDSTVSIESVLDFAVFNIPGGYYINGFNSHATTGAFGVRNNDPTYKVEFTLSVTYKFFT